MVSVTTKVELDGNFFRRDPGKTLRGNVRAMVVALADELEVEVKTEIVLRAAAMPYYSGWSHAHTVGRAESQSGRDWGTWAVVSANTAGMSRHDAIRTKAAASSIEHRFHPYRLIKGAVFRARALLRADLSKGLD